jgi:hypothetical protein
MGRGWWYDRDGFGRLLSEHSRVYNVGWGYATTALEIAETLKELLGHVEYEWSTEGGSDR